MPAATGPREASIVRRLIEHLRKLRARGEPVAWRKVHGTAMGTIGEPDLDVCYFGKSLKLEAKVPGNKPTRMQMHRMREWAFAGAVVGVVHSVEDLDELLKAAREGTDTWNWISEEMQPS